MMARSILWLPSVIEPMARGLSSRIRISMRSTVSLSATREALLGTMPVRYQGRCPPSALADSAVLLCSVVSSQSAFILCVRAAALQTTALSRNGARRGVPVELQPLFCLMSRRLRGRPAIHAMVPLSNAGNRGTSHRPIPPCTANLPGHGRQA